MVTYAPYTAELVIQCRKWGCKDNVIRNEEKVQLGPTHPSILWAMCGVGQLLHCEADCISCLHNYPLSRYMNSQHSIRTILPSDKIKRKNLTFHYMTSNSVPRRILFSIIYTKIQTVTHYLSTWVSEATRIQNRLKCMCNNQSISI